MEKNTKSKIKILFLTFYNSYPITSGASNISSNFYKFCPFQKKLFLINHEKDFKNKNISNFKPISNRPIYKILVLFPYLFKVISEIIKFKPTVIIFEGASWIGYSFVFYIILKTFFKNIKFIYHGHNIDFDIRKKKFFLGKLTFILEKYLANNIDIFTAVSKYDQKRIYNLYNKKVKILKNGVNYSIGKKNKKKNLILFSGSLEFDENRIAFNNFYKNVYPVVKSKLNKFEIVVTGNKSKIDNRVKQLGVLDYTKYINLLKKTKTCIYQFRKGPGTKIKVIEALCNNIPVLTNKHGFQGIEIKDKKKLIFKSKSELINKLNIILNKQNNSNFNSIYREARKKFNIKTISNEFFKDLQNKI